MNEYLKPTTSNCKSENDFPDKHTKVQNPRRSWSLIDSKADQKVLMEMGMSLLQYDDADVQADSKASAMHTSRNVLADIGNFDSNKGVSPKSLTTLSPNPLSPKSRSSKCKSTEKNKSQAIKSEDVICIPDEETPSGQSVSSEYHKIYASTLDSGSNCGTRKRRASYTALDDKQDASIDCKSSRCDSGVDAFGALSDEMMLSIFWWLPKLSLQNCMLVNKRWLRIASDETLWPKIDLSNKVLTKGALGNILSRKPTLMRMCYTEISEWTPSGSPVQSKLQYLDLSMCSVSVETLDNLLSTCHSLKKLSLENVAVRDSTCRLIGQSNQLETLNVTMSLGIQSKGLLDIIKGCNGLLSLNISWCYLSEEALLNLVSNVPPTVQRLNLAGARLLTDEMVATLAKSCPRLLELDLSDCSRLTGAAVTAVLGLQRLEHLALSRCYLLQPDMLILLTEMPSLIYLDVFGMLPTATLNTLRASMKEVQINQFRFSAVARPTVGVRRTSVWGLKTRD